MGGSGGGSTFSRISPEALQSQIREAEMQLADEAFTPRLNEVLDEYLSNVNARDAEEIGARLSQAYDILKDTIQEKLELRYGGSVAKHTYVDGLSDIDSLLIIHTDRESAKDPKFYLDNIASELSQALPADVVVSRGRMAVTVTYPQGAEIQLVPALRANNRLHVPSSSVDEWSQIRPENFTRGLTKRNDECNGKLVPTIKLAKSVNATLPEEFRLSGYHIESLAISAFRNYGGTKTISKMLPYFFRKIPVLLQGPIRDSTGQSVNVDDYLGKKGSKSRLERAHLFTRIGRRMDNATAAGSLDQWRAIISE